MSCALLQAATFALAAALVTAALPGRPAQAQTVQTVPAGTSFTPTGWLKAGDTLTLHLNVSIPSARTTSITFYIVEGYGSETNGCANVSFGFWAPRATYTNRVNVSAPKTIPSYGDQMHDMKVCTNLGGLSKNRLKIDTLAPYMTKLKAAPANGSTYTVTFRDRIARSGKPGSGLRRVGMGIVGASDSAAACDTYAKVNALATKRTETLATGAASKDLSLTLPDNATGKVCFFAEDVAGNTFSDVVAIATDNAAPMLTVDPADDVADAWKRSHSFKATLIDADGGDRLHLIYDATDTAAACEGTGFSINKFSSSSYPPGFRSIASVTRTGVISGRVINGTKYAVTFNSESDNGKFACFVATDEKTNTTKASARAMKIDRTAPMIAFPPGVTPAVGNTSAIMLKDAAAKVKKYGAIVVDGATGAEADCDSATKVDAANLTTLDTPASPGNSNTPRRRTRRARRSASTPRTPRATARARSGPPLSPPPARPSRRVSGPPAATAP